MSVLGKITMKKESVLNVPRAVLVFALALIVLQLLRSFGGEEVGAWLILNLAFIPNFFSADFIGTYSLLDARPWSPFTYALLHGGWQHVLMNTLWLAAFGSPVARRFGTLRFVLLCLIAAPAGALAHYLAYSDDLLPLVGASAVISALTAAAVRFVFEPNGPMMNRDNPRAVFCPAPPLSENLKNPQAMIFIIIWFAINFVFGAGSSLAGADMQIAWQAHIGGFVVGLLLFPLFDPVKKPA
jgi:membrane associated rhomboid family serine protease